MKGFIEKLPSGPRKKKLKSENEVNQCDTKAKTRQMYIDFGQKSFAKQLECSRCNMRYVAGDSEDEVRHKAFCSAANKPIKLPARWQTGTHFNVLQSRYEAPMMGSFQSSSSSSESAIASTNLRPVIVKIHRRKLHSTPFINLIGNLLSEQCSAQEFALAGDISCIMCVTPQSREVLGCLIYEQVPTTELIRLPRGCDVSTVTFSVEKTALTIDSKNRHESDQNKGYRGQDQIQSLTPCVLNTSELKPLADNSNPELLSKQSDSETIFDASVLGIRQLWVRGNCRRSGIARRLVDCARAAAMCSLDFTNDWCKVAFSQPTQDGCQFAYAYTKSEMILIYPGVRV